MPELPEVEVVRRGLQQWVVGRGIDDVEVLHPRAVRRHRAGTADLRARLRGQIVQAAHRRGKYLWLPLGQTAPGAGPDAPPNHGGGHPDRPEAIAGEALLAHLGMSGQLLVSDAADPDQTHLRVRIGFADGGPQLRFVDQRTFGGLAVDEVIDLLRPPGPVGRQSRLPRTLAHIAPDPLEPDFDLPWVIARLRARHSGLKRALLDQTLVSGIGNIYADEALWRARLHGARRTEGMRRSELERLFAAVLEVFTEALAAGGTSFDSLYVNVNGASGYFDRALAVYGRAGRPCQRCARPVRRDTFMNRSAFSCPGCQPAPRVPRW